MVEQPLIDRVRESSRQLVREFGFLRPQIASTSLPASALHTLLELDLHGPQTANDLCQSLNLEKSSVSRLLKKLLNDEHIQAEINQYDARSKLLKLTAKGRAVVSVAHQHAQHQVEQALSRLSPTQQVEVDRGLSSYAGALASGRTDSQATQNQGLALVCGYRPGAIGCMSALFARYFACHYDFGVYFERKVSSDINEFFSRIEHQNNQVWLVVEGEHILGSIAVDGQDLRQADAAHLRWFILDQRLRGTGMGRRLLQAAIQFCDDQGFKEIHLWTVKGLDAAAHLYDEFGFELEKEWLGDQWGAEVVEHHRVRRNKVVT